LISAINSGLSGLAVHSAMVTNAAGNLANLNTTGYKSSRLALGTLPSMSPGGNEVGQGAQILATYRDFSTGPPLQLAAGTGGAGGLTQTALEGSNVDPAREMIDLMLGQRGFQASIKVLQTAGEMLGSVLDIRA
jgi:flagellar hook protein FlgE